MSEQHSTEWWVAAIKADKEREEANARVIAAAPELLEALERTLSWLTSYPGGIPMRKGGVYDQARAAIFKATGVQS